MKRCSRGKGRGAPPIRGTKGVNLLEGENDLAVFGDGACPFRARLEFRAHTPRALVLVYGLLQLTAEGSWNGGRQWKHYADQQD